MEIKEILEKKELSRGDLVRLLSSNAEEAKLIFEKALSVKQKYNSNKVHLRGLIEYSNKCSKNCYYCGVRGGNTNVVRYTVEVEEILEAVQFAIDNKFGSLVIQAGERSDKKFTDDITHLLEQITKLTKGKLHITLSLGEQTDEVYTQWLKAGAHRFLLRIEAANPVLYRRLHPDDSKHSYNNRILALRGLRNTGYQTGTGVMIGLPFQRIEDLATDLLFFREIDIDMIGMGPWIEQEDSPLWKYKDDVPSKEERFFLTLKMVALARIMLKDVNIAATTAMQTLNPEGRKLAVQCGANVIMPNLTPLKYRENYMLYEDKPGVNEDIEDSLSNIEGFLAEIDHVIAYGEHGDPKHFKRVKS